MTLLEIAGLSKAYRGIHAVRNTSFRVEQGTITGLIGPNGSGKTTTIDCITGFQQADAGRIRLEDRDISDLPPQRIARAGLLRTFQTVRIYDDFDLMQNLLAVTAPFADVTGWDMFLRRRRFREAHRQAARRAQEAIDLVGLTRLIDAPAEDQPLRNNLSDRRAQCRVHHESLRSCAGARSRQIARRRGAESDPDGRARSRRLSRAGTAGGTRSGGAPMSAPLLELIALRAGYGDV